MAKKRLFFQIFPTYLVIIFIAIFVLSWYAAGALKSFYLNEMSAGLEARANLIREYILNNNSLNSADLGRVCIELSKSSNTRVTIISESGKVLADSEEDPFSMDNHSDRMEIKQAVQGKTGASIRYSYTLNKEMMYLALPFFEDNKVIAVIRLSLPLSSLERIIWQIQRRIIGGGIIIAMLAALVSFFISRRISKPLEKIKEGAKHFANGEFDQKLHTTGAAEISSLAETLNQMARQLDERIKTISQQRSEQEAVLSSMVEGVLAVNNDERIIRINRAATDFFQIDSRKSSKRLIHEVIRNTALLDFIQKTLKSGERIETEISILDDMERILLVKGSALQNAEGVQIGALIVMNDVTQIKQLENMRSEFVGNVSHELKTPITSIKGFVETLREGSVKETEKANQFLDIIAKHTDRMNSIIDDLLNLSRIEQYKGKVDIQLNMEQVLPVLRGAVQDCQNQIEQKQISIQVDCDENLTAAMNAPLLEQAFTNLLDNAVKYSEPGGKIKISVCEKGGELIITVQDWGCGIERTHHARLFERFYRVDKARSRKLGGTGLGLSIVKHIASIHNGKVFVESSPGKGSAFSIHLPRS